VPVLGRKLYPGPLAKGRRAGADIHRHVKHLAGHGAHQLALRLVHLVMQPAQRAAYRAGMVTLHKRRHAECFQFTVPVRLHKEAAGVFKHLWNH